MAITRPFSHWQLKATPRGWGEEDKNYCLHPISFPWPYMSSITGEQYEQRTTFPQDLFCFCNRMDHYNGKVTSHVGVVVTQRNGKSWVKLPLNHEIFETVHARNRITVTDTL